MLSPPRDSIVGPIRQSEGQCFYGTRYTILCNFLSLPLTGFTSNQQVGGRCYVRPPVSYLAPGPGPPVGDRSVERGRVVLCLGKGY